jgi:hypothetical protein
MRRKKVRRSRNWLISIPPYSAGCASAFADLVAALDVSEQPAGTGIEPPGDADAGQVEDEEGPQRRLRTAGKADRTAVALRDEEGAVRGDGGGEADDRGALFLCLPCARARIGAWQQAIHFLAHHGGYHLEGGGVADTANKEQEQEHREEADPTSQRKEVDDADDPERHADEDPEGDATPSPAVGHPAGEGTR